MTGLGWALIVVVAVAVEAFLHATKRELLSRWVWRQLPGKPFLAFAAGFLCGHLFWPGEGCLNAIQKGIAELVMPRVLAAETVRPTVMLRLIPPPTVFLRAPATVEARVILRDPARVATCPAFQWTWGEEGSSSWEETSCDPFAFLDLHPTEYRPAARRHVFYMAGEHRIRITVRGGDRRRAYAAERAITVLGLAEEH